MHPLVALLAVAFAQQPTTTLPDTLPGKRFDEFMTAFNTKSSKQIDAMIARNFAQSALRILSKEEWTTRISGATNVAPISVDEVLKSSDSTIVVRIKSKSIAPLAIRLDLESEAPFGIVGAKMGAPADLLDSTAPRRYTKWETITTLAEQIQADYKLPSLSIAYKVIGSKSQEISVGVKSTFTKDVMEPGDRLWIGGAGKAMTATLIAHMVDMKKISWKTTIAEAMPGFPMSDVYKDVTLEQLIHHLGRIPQHVQIIGTKTEKEMADAPTSTAIRKAYVAAVLNQEQAPITSSSFDDSDVDFTVAAYMLERLIGKPYEWLMQRYVFEPMKLSTVLIQQLCTDGQVGTPGNVYGHLISDQGGFTPYQIPGSKVEIALAPAGSCITCTLTDLVKFAEFHLKGIQGDAQVLTADSYKRIHSLLNGKGTACGWTINPSYASEACQSISSSNGAFAVDLSLWPDNNMVIAAIANAASPKRPSPTMQAVLAVRDRIEKKG